MPQQLAINGVEFARRADSLDGELPLELMSRLEDVLFERAGRVKFVLQGSLGSRSEPLLHLKVEGVVCLQCQRCMERVEQVLAIDTVFELVSENAELTQEALEDDSRDYLPLAGELDVAELVEEEVILALPVAPRHEDCSVPSRPTEGGAESPFGALAVLKQEIH